MTGSYRRLSPTQSRKLGEVAVAGDPNAGVLDGERREPSVRNSRPSNLGFGAQALENRPMPLAGLDNLAVRLAEKIVTKAERFLQRTGLDEGAGVGRYPRDSAQHEGRNAETSFAAHDPIEPSLAGRMARRVFAESIDEDIHVG
jgi:hypothetical protein